MATNLYAPPKAALADLVPAEAAPALWNPGAAASWSVLLSPAFGAFLHMKNWQALGEPDKAAAAKRWVATYGALVVVWVAAGVLLPHNRSIAATMRLSNVALLLGWYFASGKPQMNLVKARYAKDYPRKAWVQPIFVALVLLFGLGLIVGFLAGMVSGFVSLSG